MREFEQIAIESRDGWRRWLRENSQHNQSVWAVTWKKGSGGPHVPYGDVRDEALCFGWIDSLPRKLDAERSMLLVSPRKPGSAWSKVNKDRAAALIAEGRMAAPGLAAIERAQADGSWTALDGVETLAPPADLAAALTVSGASDRFAAFAPSSRRGILEWITLAKQPETRARRVSETARLAALGLRANHPEAKGK
jgi:uncharacterized protein YdeI (YjbR/CyaY-like superfamily)